MSNTRRKVAALLPLAERLHRGHCWLKTTDGPRRISEPLDEFKLAEHAAGRKAYGACPIAPGTSTTHVACLDFDSHKGETEWSVMMETAQSVAFLLEQDGYVPHLFRSSGGNGVHLYLLWDDPQDAYSVRIMLGEILSGLGLASGTGGVAKRQVEVFPKQDEVPSDGFGSMFILPGSGKSEPLTEFTGWHSSAPVAITERPVKPERVVSSTPEIERLRSALDAIPNDTDPLDYDTWRNVLFALHEATDGSGEGLGLAHEFSARSSKYDPDFLDNRFWPYAGVTSGDRITARSLFAVAGQHGWVDPAIADDFDVVEEAAEEEKAALPLFTPVRVAEFAVGKPMDWLIKNVIPRADLGMVFGASGSGKSFLMIDMAGSIARGVPWRDKTVKRGRVCYVVAEGAAGFRKRIDAYCAHQGIAIDDLDIYVIADAPNLKEKAHVKALTDSLKAAGPFDLVVLDTLAAVSAGADENSAQDMGVILDRARAVGRAAGAMTLLVHHAGKQADRGARGSTALKGRVDVEIEVVRMDQDRAATVSKLRDQDDRACFGFKLLTVPVGMDDEGEVIDSCVIEHSADTQVMSYSGAPRGKTEVAVHKIVLDLLDVGEGPSVTEVLSEYENRTPHDALAKRDTRRQVANRALQSLLQKGTFVLSGTRLGLVVAGEGVGDE